MRESTWNGLTLFLPGDHALSENWLDWGVPWSRASSRLSARGAVGIHYLILSTIILIHQKHFSCWFASQVFLTHLLIKLTRDPLHLSCYARAGYLVFMGHQRCPDNIWPPQQRGHGKKNSTSLNVLLLTEISIARWECQSNEKTWWLNFALKRHSVSSPAECLFC